MNLTLNQSIPCSLSIIFTILFHYYVNSFHINSNPRRKNISAFNTYNQYKYDHPYLKNHNQQPHHHSPLFLSYSSHSSFLQEKGEEFPSSNNDNLSTYTNTSTPLSMSIDELALQLNGKGRALTTWDCYKVGLDPLYFFSHESNANKEEKENDDDEEQMKFLWDHNVYNILSKSSSSSFFDNHSDQVTTTKTTNTFPKLTNNNQNNYRTQFTKQFMPMKRQDIHNNQEGKGLSKKTLNELSSKLYPNSLGIEYSIASLVNLQRSNDGTVKLLLKLNNNGDKEYYIESVIIPWYDRSNPTSTLCVSTQVGCAQGKLFNKNFTFKNINYLEI